MSRSSRSAWSLLTASVDVRGTYTHASPATCSGPQQLYKINGGVPPFSLHQSGQGGAGKQLSSSYLTVVVSPHCSNIHMWCCVTESDLQGRTLTTFGGRSFLGVGASNIWHATFHIHCHPCIFSIFQGPMFYSYKKVLLLMCAQSLLHRQQAAIPCACTKRVGLEL